MLLSLLVAIGPWSPLGGIGIDGCVIAWVL